MKNTTPILAKTLTTLVLTASIAWASSAHGAAVTLQQATATFSQTLGASFPAATAIDGLFDAQGWAISQNDGLTTNAETAVFETATDVGFIGGSVITFTLTQTYPNNPFHTLGRFRLSVTTDNRSLFADGLQSGGDVTANWIVLDPSTFGSANGATLTELGDNSILASGTSPATDIYTVSAPTTLTGITGVRLEALADASLPASGPGRASANGNFVLTEFQMDLAVPEPASGLLLAMSGAGLILRSRSRRSREGKA